MQWIIKRIYLICFFVIAYLLGFSMLVVLVNTLCSVVLQQGNYDCSPKKPYNIVLYMHIFLIFQRYLKSSTLQHGLLSTYIRYDKWEGKSWIDTL